MIYQTINTYCPHCCSQETHILRPEDKNLPREKQIAECTQCISLLFMKKGYKTTPKNKPYKLK